MNAGIRSWLFWVSALGIGGFGLLAGFWVEAQLRGLLEGRIEQELLDEARMVREIIGPAYGPPETLDPLADRLGAASGSRVTIIAASGEVLGDSEVALARLPDLENHAGRPEVVEALANGDHGVDRRTSATLDRGLLYVAVPHASGGAVRAATPTELVDRAVWQLRVLLGGAIGLGLVGALFMSQLAATLAARDLRALAGQTLALTRGEREPRAGPARGASGELERAVAELAAERERFEAILKSMREAVLALDPRGRVTLVNPAAQALLELDDGAVGAPLEDAVALPELRRLVNAAMLGEPAAAELDLSERSLHLLATANPLSEGGCVVVLHDVTGIRKLQDIRRDFVANVSHELRTPVSVLITCAEALESGALDEPQHAERFVRSILSNAERMRALLSDLLNLSRIEAGQYDVSLQPVHLASLARRALERIAVVGGERELKLSISENLRAEADPQALEHVLTNLLENALKYTDADGHIELRAKKMGTHVRIEVRDDGPGVPIEHQARIFERFYRVDSGRSREVGGTGLGLAIVKHLVETMGGQVGMRSWKPRGSVFWIILRTSR